MSNLRSGNQTNKLIKEDFLTLMNELETKVSDLSEISRKVSMDKKDRNEIKESLERLNKTIKPSSKYLSD